MKRVSKKLTLSTFLYRLKAKRSLALCHMLNTYLNVIRFSVQFISDLLISWLWQIDESTVVSDLILSSISSGLFNIHWQVSRTRFRQVINNFLCRFQVVLIGYLSQNFFKLKSLLCLLFGSDSFLIYLLSHPHSFTFRVRHKPCVLCGPSARRLKCATRSACSTLSWMLTERWTERVTSPRRSPSVTVSPSCQGSLVSVMYCVAHKHSYLTTLWWCICGIQRCLVSWLFL